MTFLRGSSFLYLVVIIAGIHSGVSLNRTCQERFNMCLVELAPLDPGCRSATAQRYCIKNCIEREDLMDRIEKNVVRALGSMCNGSNRIQRELPFGEPICIDMSDADDCQKAKAANMEMVIMENNPESFCSITNTIWDCVIDKYRGLVCDGNVMPYAMENFITILDETVVSQFPMCTDSRMKRSVEFVKRK